jgi:hypothetical protein
MHVLFNFIDYHYNHDLGSFVWISSSSLSLVSVTVGLLTFEGCHVAFFLFSMFLHQDSNV